MSACKCLRNVLLVSTDFASTSVRARCCRQVVNLFKINHGHDSEFAHGFHPQRLDVEQRLACLIPEGGFSVCDRNHGCALSGARHPAGLLYTPQSSATVSSRIGATQCGRAFDGAGVHLTAEQVDGAEVRLTAEQIEGAGVSADSHSSLHGNVFLYDDIAEIDDIAEADIADIAEVEEPLIP